MHTTTVTGTIVLLTSEGEGGSVVLSLNVSIRFLGALGQDPAFGPPRAPPTLPDRTLSDVTARVESGAVAGSNGVWGRGDVVPCHCVRTATSLPLVLHHKWYASGSGIS